MPPAPKRKDQLEGALERAVAQLSSVAPAGCLPRAPAQFLSEAVSGCVELRLPEAVAWQFAFLRRSVLLHCEQQSSKSSHPNPAGDGPGSGPSASAGTSGSAAALSYRTPFDSVLRHVLRHEGTRLLRHFIHLSAGFSQQTPQSTFMLPSASPGSTGGGVSLQLHSWIMNHASSCCTGGAGWAIGEPGSAPSSPISSPLTSSAGAAVGASGGSTYLGSLLSIAEDLWAVDRRVNSRPSAPSTAAPEDTAVDARVVFAFLSSTLFEVLDGIASPGYILWAILTVGRRMLALSELVTSSAAVGLLQQRYTGAVESRLFVTRTWLCDGPGLAPEKASQMLRDVARLLDEAFAPPVTAKRRHHGSHVAASMAAVGPPPPPPASMVAGSGGGIAAQPAEVGSIGGAATTPNTSDGPPSAGNFTHDGNAREEVFSLVELLAGHPRAMQRHRGGFGLQPIPLQMLAHLLDVAAALCAIYRSVAVPLYALVHARACTPGQQHPTTESVLSFLSQTSQSAAKTLAGRYNTFCGSVLGRPLPAPSGSSSSGDGEPFGQFLAHLSSMRRRAQQTLTTDIPMSVFALALVQPLSSGLW